MMLTTAPHARATNWLDTESNNQATFPRDISPSRVKVSARHLVHVSWYAD